MSGAPAIHAFFQEESRAYVQRITSLLAEDDALVDAETLLDHTRALRGTAQLGRDAQVLRAARLLEGAAHALLEGTLTWSSDVRERFELTLGDVQVALAGTEEPAGIERRLDAASDRWRALDVRPWMPAAEADAATERPVDLDDEPFLSFAAGEIDGIVTVLRDSLDALAENGMDRDAMTSVLRRQRALLGAARLDELPAVAETLRAVEDVSRIIARMNIAIKDEWLDVFRCAKVVLEASAEPLARGDDPPHTPALSRLRTYRQELVERYGTADDTPATTLLEEAATTPDAAVPAASRDEPAATRTEATSIDIQNLVYTGEAALRRALDLRARLERAVENDPDALALVDEVFDLIRLGLL